MKPPVPHRPRVGLVLPSAQVVTEPLFNRVMGQRWDFLAARVLIKGARPEHLRRMECEIPRAVEELATARVDALVSCCTASGALNGLERDRAQCREIQRSTGVPTTSTMLSIVANLRALEARSLVVVTPYVAELASVEHHYLQDNGFSIVSSDDDEIDDPFAMSMDPVEHIVGRALDAWDDSADAMLLSCMNWPAYQAIGAIEEQIGAPVVTSHSATLWGLHGLLSAPSE
ncbi:maleate cis-trans isomerase family protein [Mycolicibacterium palauense]|uniref:maleate cis-trans isomerase family protein n=1 Tax=Mycolicibacterium palauense TaxID=2034511 RepID=UPI00114521AF|nr:hypothetical protein [Mycolicibacterium palauense]